jgi:hypothetical protein
MILIISAPLHFAWGRGLATLPTASSGGLMARYRKFTTTHPPNLALRDQLVELFGAPQQGKNLGSIPAPDPAPDPAGLQTLRDDLLLEVTLLHLFDDPSHFRIITRGRVKTSHRRFGRVLYVTDWVHSPFRPEHELALIESEVPT